MTTATYQGAAPGCLLSILGILEEMLIRINLKNTAQRWVYVRGFAFTVTRHGPGCGPWSILGPGFPHRAMHAYCPTLQHAKEAIAFETLRLEAERRDPE